MIKRVKLATLFLLICATLILAVKTTEIGGLNDKLDALRIENAELKAKNEEIVDLKEEIAKSKDSLRQKEEELRVVEKMMSSLFADGKYTELGVQELQKIEEIVRTTPLDLEAAAALVHYVEMYDLDYSLILSIIELESEFNPALVGYSNDRGFMQIIPITERNLVDLFGEKIGVEYDPSRIFEPDYNLGLGISYIAYLVDIHGSNKDKILTEYNRGAGGLQNYYANYSTYSSTYSRSVINRTAKYASLDESENLDEVENSEVSSQEDTDN